MDSSYPDKKVEKGCFRGRGKRFLETEKEGKQKRKPVNRGALQGDWSAQSGAGLAQKSWICR